MSQVDQRIVITGAGLSTVFGPGKAVTWANVLEGRTGLSEHPSLRPDEDDTAKGGTAGEIALLREVALEALTEAGLEPGPGRRGVVMGTTLHGIRGAGRFLRRDDPRLLADVPATRVLRDAFEGLGLDQLRLTTCSACSSGLASVALGMTLLRAGVLDVAVVGGYDPEAEYSASGFASLRLVTDGRPRPFCRDREGLRLGGGYAALVLERASDAAARGADPLAEVLGAAETADAFHLTRPHPEGRGAARALIGAMREAGIGVDDIDLVGAHATGTPANDAAEYQALRCALGARLDATPIVAFKSHLGHTLGAAGAVELVLSLLASREGMIPPAAGVSPEEIEFEGLDVVTGRARQRPIRTAMNLSIGFGGANACVVIGEPRSTSSRHAPEDVEVAVTGLGMIAPGAIGADAVNRVLQNPPESVRGGPISADEIASILAPYRLRRQSEYSRLTIAATSLALADAEVGDLESFASDCGAILGTAHGSAAYSEAYYREIVESGPEAGNPMLFAEGVPNAGAAQLSIAFGITGGCQSIVGSRGAGLEALALAALRIRRGEWRRAIVSAADEFSETVNAGYEACGLTGRAGGFIPGAGASAWVLERLDDARARGATTLATVGQCGLAFAPTGRTSDMERAVDTALGLARAEGLVVGSSNATWIGQVERASSRSHVGDDHYCSMETALPEMFAAGPLIHLGATLLRSRSSNEPGVSRQSLTGLCVDPFGPVAAATILPQ